MKNKPIHENGILPLPKIELKRVNCQTSAKPERKISAEELKCIRGELPGSVVSATLIHACLSQVLVRLPPHKEKRHASKI